MKQKISLSKGCPYSCPYCFNGLNDFEELIFEDIKSNNVEILDDAFLSKKDIVEIIKRLGSIKINNKVVYYELRQGINLHDLTQEIANELKKSRFIKIRFAWDDSYTSKSMFRLKDGIDMLLNAGYNKKDLMCFILSNYYVPYEECIKKLDLLKVWGISVCNCVYRKNYLDPKIYPIHWDMKTIKRFRTTKCRKHNLILKFGIDPELRKRRIK